MFKDIKKFFADFIENIKSRKAARLMPIVAVVCLMAILIPTLIAVWQVYFREKDTLEAGNEVSVFLYDEKGAVLAEDAVEESNIEVSTLVDIFYNLYLSKTALATTPEGIPEKPNYKVKLATGEDTISFSCYFTENAQTSYILDSAGVFYSVSETYHKKFLDLEYSDAAYSSATPPTLITKNGDEIVPFSASWSYKKQDGTVKKVDDILVSVARHTYTASGSIGFSFSRQPSFCSVQVTDLLGNEIYNGALDGISSITTEVGTHLCFTVEAEWDDINGSDSFGEISYKFNIICKTLATFSVSSSSVSPGGYFVISAYNIEDNAVPLYTPDDSRDDPKNIFGYTGPAGDLSGLAYISYIDALDFLESFSPVFFEDGEILRAIVPIPHNTPEGNFSFTLSSGASTSLHTVKIEKAASANVILLDKTREEVASVISKTTIGQVVDLVNELSAKSTDRLLARGEFLTPLSDNYTREFSYGDSFTLEDGPIARFNAIGNTYISSGSGGKSVNSANVGIVLAVGSNAHLGKYVVIDHGIGILSWYCNLSDISVREGDVIAKGDTVGKSGTSLLLDRDGVMILCTIGGAIVNPTDILGNELLYNVH